MPVQKIRGGQPLSVIGTTWCGHTTQQRIALLEAGIKYTFVNNDTNPVKGVTGFPTLVCGARGGKFTVHAGEMSAANVQKFCPQN